jgi:hypothetical protein
MGSKQLHLQNSGVSKRELSGISGVKVSMKNANGGIAYVAYSIRLENVLLERADPAVG